MYFKNSEMAITQKKCHELSECCDYSEWFSRTTLVVQTNKMALDWSGTFSHLRERKSTYQKEQLLVTVLCNISHSIDSAAWTLTKNNP